MWHMTCDMFGEANIPSKFQLPSSYCLWFMIILRSGGKGWLNYLINESINDEAVYRTAPATPGLLINATFLLLHKILYRTCHIFSMALAKGWRPWPWRQPLGRTVESNNHSRTNVSGKVTTVTVMKEVTVDAKKCVSKELKTFVSAIGIIRDLVGLGWVPCKPC